MPLRNVVKEYWQCRTTAFKESTILQAWRKSGINPFNPDIFTHADFAPSIPSSTQVHLPDSFPRRLPRAPDMSSDDALFNAEALIALEEGEEGRESDGSKESDEGDEDSVSDSSESDSEFASDSDDASQSPATFTQLELRRTRSQTSQLSVTSSSPSLSSSSARFSTASSARSEELAQLRLEIANLKQENAGLKLESASIKAQRDAAQAHAVFAGQQFAVYKHRYNNKVNKKESSKRVTTSARILTSREVRKEIEQDAAKKVQRQKVEAERETRKAEAEQADIIRRAEQERLGSEFSGSLNSMSKKALVDIAFSLKVPLKHTTQDALRVRLRAHFDAHEELKKHPRYIGLFERTRKRKDPPTESNPGPSSRRPLPPSQRSPSPGPSSFALGPSSFVPGPSSFEPGPSSFAPGSSSFALGPSSYPPSMHHSSLPPPPFFGQFQPNYSPFVFENQSPSTLHYSTTPTYTFPPPLPHNSSSQLPIPSSSSVSQPRPRPRPRPVPRCDVNHSQ